MRENGNEHDGEHDGDGGRRVENRHDVERRRASIWTCGSLIVVFVMLLSIGLLHRETSNRILRSLVLAFSGGLTGNTTDDDDGTGSAGSGNRKPDGGDHTSPGGHPGSGSSGIMHDGDHGEPSASGRSGRGKKFRRWTKFQILSQHERTGRIVAGRKESISFDLQVQPVHGMLPNREQIAAISKDLHSDLHSTTFVYFYLPGMDSRLGAWATAHHKPGDSFCVRFFKSNMPPEFR